MSFLRRFVSVLLILTATLCLWAVTSFMVSLVRAGTWLSITTPLEKAATVITCFIIAAGLVGFAAQGMFGLVFRSRSDPDAPHIAEWVKAVELSPPLQLEPTRLESTFEGRLPSLDITLKALSSNDPPLLANYGFIMHNAANDLANAEKACLIEEVKQWWMRRFPGKKPPDIFTSA